MEKNWLIRTKNHHILGPVSKDKMKELFLNGSVKGDDEICSGNGYWFFVREKELIDRYLLGQAGQEFNPVNEAENSYKLIKETESQTQAVPNAEDLEFPDLGESDQKKTDLNILEQKTQTNVIELKAKVTNKKSHSDIPIVPVKPKLMAKAGENTLLFVALILVFILIVAFYYRKTIIREFINADISIIKNLHADDDVAAQKKNLFLIAPIINKNYKIIPQRSLFGFHYKIEFNGEFECEDLKDLAFWLTYIDGKENESKENTKLKTCINSLKNNSTYKIYQYKKLEIPYVGELQEIKKNTQEDDNSKLLKIINNQDYYNKNFNREKLFSKIAVATKTLQKYRYSWSLRVIEAFLYLRMENRGRCFLILSQLLNLNPMTNENYQASWTNSQKEKLNQRFKFAIKYILENLNSPIVNSMMYEYFKNYFPEEEFDEFLSDEKPFNSQDILNLTKNPIWGKRFPGVWYPLLYEKYGLQVANEYLEQNLYFFRKLQKGDFRMIYLLSEFKTSKPEIIKKLGEIFLKFKQSKRTSDKENLIFLSDSKILKSKDFNEFEVKLSYKRDYYRMNLIKGRSFKYNFFNLLKLGDFSPNYFEYYIK
jgi:hypothetical protein